MMQEHLSQQASQRGMQVDSWTSASTNFEFSLEVDAPNLK
jgi:hypothetical protein